MTLPALYIGRFQPFHLGHLDALKQIFAHESRIIIAIGSAEDNYIPENPFTASERYQIIEASLVEAKINPSQYTIIPVQNIDNYALWCDYLDTMLPLYGSVYTGSPIVKSLYEKQKKHPVKILKLKLPISSTVIREKILSDKPWNDLVSPACQKLLMQFSAVERMKNITR